MRAPRLSPRDMRARRDRRLTLALGAIAATIVVAIFVAYGIALAMPHAFIRP